MSNSRVIKSVSRLLGCYCFHNLIFIPIALTLDILKHAKRFHATVSFIADTGLKEQMELGMSSTQTNYR